MGNDRLYHQRGFAPVSLVLLVAVLILGAAGAYYYSSHRTPSSSSSTSDANPRAMTLTSQPTEALSGEVSSNLTDIVGRGQNLECDIKVPVEAGNNNPFNTGKLWTTGRQGRSTLTAQVSGMTMEANAVYKEGTAYSWVITNGVKMGFKFSPDATHTTMTAQQRQQAEQAKQRMLFNCHSWTPDQSKFTLPSDVEFRAY